MASNGYIVVAPNRRGMPGHGTAWNEEISKDHGGQVMDDYLSAIDAVSKESYVDKDRLGAIGASYGAILFLCLRVFMKTGLKLSSRMMVSMICGACMVRLRNCFCGLGLGRPILGHEKQSR